MTRTRLEHRRRRQMSMGNAAFRRPSSALGSLFFFLFFLFFVWGAAKQVLQVLAGSLFGAVLSVLAARLSLSRSPASFHVRVTSVHACAPLSWIRGSHMLLPPSSSTSRSGGPWLHPLSPPSFISARRPQPSSFLSRLLFPAVFVPAHSPPPLTTYIPSTANSVPPPPRPLGTADRAWLGLTRLDCPPTCRLRAGDECSGLSIVHPAAPRHSSTTTSTTAAFPVCRQAGQDTYNPPTTSAPFPCRWHRTVESTTLPGPL